MKELPCKSLLIYFTIDCYKNVVHSRHMTNEKQISIKFIQISRLSFLVFSIFFFYTRIINYFHLMDQLNTTFSSTHQHVSKSRNKNYFQSQSQHCKLPQQFDSSSKQFQFVFCFAGLLVPLTFRINGNVPRSLKLSKQ